VAAARKAIYDCAVAVQTSPSIFVNYSHADKPVVRCIVRVLAAHGIKVWMDERELRVGSTLTSSIRSQIQAAGMVLVVASKTSAISEWVGSELDFARQHGKAVVPFFIENLSGDERFRDHLGIDATLPQKFADAVDGLARDLYRSSDMEQPSLDRAILTSELRELAREEPELAPLIIGCLDSEGLHQESMDTVFKSAYHPLDFALNALFALRSDERMAMHAAYGFHSAGAGARALSLWVGATGDGGPPLVNAVGRRLDSAVLPTAIRLLESCQSPNNQALYSFIHENADQFDEKLQRAVIRLVTWPVRDTGNLADVLGWVAIKRFPDSVQIQQMWIRWVQTGAFDGKPSSPTDLARYLVDAHKEGLRGWDGIEEALRGHVRRYIRSGDKQKVIIAVNHLRAAADRGAPVFAALFDEVRRVRRNGTNGRSATGKQPIRWHRTLKHLRRKLGEIETGSEHTRNGSDSSH
jgi:hypothetical protein